MENQRDDPLSAVVPFAGLLVALAGAVIPLMVAVVGAGVYIGGLRGDVDEMVEDVGGLTGQAEGLVVSTADLQGRVGGLEFKVGNLEDGLNKLENTPPDTAVADRDQAQSDGSEARPVERTQRTFPNTGRWGTWSEPVFCPEGQYVCGLQQKVERSLAKGHRRTRRRRILRGGRPGAPPEA